MTSTDSTSFCTKTDEKDDDSRIDSSSSRPTRPRNFGSTIALGNSTFESLALDVSFSGLASASTPRTPNFGNRNSEERDPEIWEDIGVVEYLERGLSPGDESSAEDREETLRQVLSETDIHEGDGDMSDFLFHVARTKHGRIYIRVIRTLLLNRGRVCYILINFTIFHKKFHFLFYFSFLNIFFTLYLGFIFFCLEICSLVKL